MGQNETFQQLLWPHLHFVHHVPGRLPLRREQLPEIIPSHSLKEEEGSAAEAAAVNKITSTTAPHCTEAAAAAGLSRNGVAGLWGNLATFSQGYYSFPCDYYSKQQLSKFLSKLDIYNHGKL